MRMLTNTKHATQQSKQYMTNNINMSYTLCLTLGKPNLDCAQGDKLKCSLINLQTQTLNVTFNPFTALLQ